MKKIHFFLLGSLPLLLDSCKDANGAEHLRTGGGIVLMIGVLAVVGYIVARLTGK